MPEESPYRIQAVWTALQIAKVVGDAKTPLGFKEIARDLAISDNTAYRMCETLKEAGMLEETGGKYSLGMLCMLLWARAKSKLESERERIDRLLTAVQIDS